MTTYNVKPTLPAVFSNTPTLTLSQHRQRFEELEKKLFELPQLTEEDFNLVEYKVGGMYGRQITVPKGALITGRVYKRDHLEIMLSGDIYILSANGGVTHYTGYNVIPAKAGKRQAGFAIEDTVWLTVNLAPEDIESPLDYTAVIGFDEYYKYIEEVNRQDYADFISELGLTEGQIQSLVQYDDVVELPEEYSHIYVAESRLAGLGLFSKVDINAGEEICPARIGLNRTIAGRYSNHAAVPNTKFVGLMVVAATDIPAGEEITMNYRDVLKHRRAEGDL